MGKVLVVGSFNLDQVVRTERIPKPGETLLGTEFFTAPGGKGANQAVAAARLGAEVSFVCRLGRDAAGEAARKSFVADGMDVRFVTQDPKLPTGTALIVVSQDGQNSIVVAPGANAALSSSCVEAAFEAVPRADVILTQLETPLEGVEKILAHAHGQGKLTILNPAPAREKLPDTILRHVSILTPNESEAETLTGVAVSDAASAAKAAALLHERGVPSVIVTLGEKGAYVSHRGRDPWSELVPAREAKVLDTTAAGDVFSGALATGLSEGRSLLEAARFAAQAASLSVERLGAQPSIPFRRELT